MLDDESNWSPAWDFDDAQDARVRLLQRLGRNDEARAVLRHLAHRAITDGDDGVVDLFDQLEELGEDETTLAPLRIRMQRVRKPEPGPGTGATAPTIPVSVLFVGGNETQSAYEDALQGWFTDAYPGCRLEFRFSGWGSNWGRLVDDLTRRLDGADALVLMRFVRTGLGRAMRRAASNQAKPWVACSGHGREALRLAIGHAVDKARQIKQKSTPTA